MHEPLAVVGMACRLPGGDDLQAFWQLLQSGAHGIGPFPESFVDRELYLTDQKGVRGKSYSDVGGLIKDRPIDWSVMPLDPTEAKLWDPCHLILCEVAANACIQAGYDPRHLPIKRAGVYIGHSGGSTRGGEMAYHALLTDYVDLLEDLSGWQQLSPDARKYAHSQLLERLRANRPTRQAGGGPTVDAGCAAGLISRAFGLSGPQMSIDAACASSLVALSLGAAALHAGQIDMAIVGGASYNKFDSLILFSHAQSCSASSSRPFDAAADGLISSEGYVVFVLKTLARAQADGDRIEAVIRGIGISSDGRGRSLWAPRKEGQATAIERAYSPGITADSVQLVEAHATSTQVGDATEMEALASFFRARLSPGKRVPVGSVKSNIGHSLETAGLAGVLKAILSIQHGTIPPSINVQQLSSSIPWSEIPLYVPKACEPWPALPPGQPRRAAVNAFGIGGLNVHVIVDQFLSESNPTTVQQRAPHSTVSRPEVSERPALPAVKTAPAEPIAIVGRGLVLPGAMDVAAFARKLREHVVSLSPPPSHRWRRPVAEYLPADRLNVLAGYITDYQYDWRKHKVPPKQIAQANPLQFMLLEAAEQALREAGYLDKAWDRQRAAVVVGSVFGGEFGNALYAGLRLPEFQRELSHILSNLGASPQFIAELASQYEAHFLKTFPALLDETGSFTSSTLASRLSKTFDLMGGAMAIDAGDASSLAALDAGIGLLRSGVVDHVLCATGQSALDRASLNRLSLAGKLVERNTFEQTPAGQRDSLMPSIPAEGVALVLLKRLRDAQSQGDKVLATIHNLDALPGASPHAPSAFESSPRAAQSMRTVGNLFGAQGLVEIIEVSLDTSSTQVARVAQQTDTGLFYCASVQPGAPANQSHADKAEQTVEPTHHGIGAIALKPTILRLVADDCGSLVNQLNQIASQAWPAAIAASRDHFTPSNTWQAAMVVNEEDYRTKAKLLSSQLGKTNAVVPLQEQGVFWSEPSLRVGKVAWLFPGQGSQYPLMLRDWVTTDSIAAAAVAECNAVMASLGEPTFEQLAWSQQSQLGEDVWHTQACMLISDYVMMRWLQSQGFHADVVAGHSFGEFPAMLAAGCWDLATALKATWHRCRSIVNHVPAACGMLSIQAAPHVVENLIDASKIQVHISHRNAPEQTVVGGKQAAVAQFAQLVDNEGLTSRLLAVPTAFHTPALAAAQVPFAQSLQSLVITTPKLPLLSSVDTQYATDPVAIRAALAAQLVTPLDYVSLVERLLSDGVRLVVEVGPHQVLTRLTRQIAGSRLMVLSTDHLKRGTAFQLLAARAGLEVMSSRIEQERVTVSTTTTWAQAARSNQATASSRTSSQPLHFDATAVRRERMRQSASKNQSVNTPATLFSPAPVMQFDASQSRRDRNRQTSALPSVSDATSITRAADANIPAQPTNANSFPASNINVNVNVKGIERTGQTAPFALHSNQPGEASAKGNVVGDHVKVIEAFLIDFVVEQTGYPAEIIELDWDIEADLGIDSIKKAQLFGELREFFDLDSLTSFSLDSFKSLRDIVNLLVTLPGKGDWLSRSTGEGNLTDSPNATVMLPPLVEPKLATPVLAPSDVVAPVDSKSIASPEPTAPVAADPTMSSERMQQFLIDFVVEQTGYPPEIVDMDSDLEADLGIDSIKKAQLFGELRELFTFPVASTEENSRLALSEFRTLRSVLDLLLGSQVAATPSANGKGEVAVVAERTTTSPSAPLSPTHIDPPESENASVEGVSAPAITRSLDPTHSACMKVSTHASTHEFRSLVELPVPATPFTLLNELPVAYFTDGNDRDRSVTIVPGHHYVPALFANLQAMVGRSTSGNVELYNGQRERVSHIISQLARSVGAADISLLALDAIVLQESRWYPASFELKPSVEVANSNALNRGSNLLAIAEYSAPVWLTNGSGIPLAAHVHTRGERTSCEWLTPGCVTGLAQLSGTSLVVGGLVDPRSHLHELLELQTWLKQQTLGDCTLAAFEKAARQLRLTGDWWAMGVDLLNTQRVLVECIDGVVVIEKGGLPLASAYAAKSCAGLYLDRGTGEVVVRTQLKPRPYGIDEARLSVHAQLHQDPPSTVPVCLPVNHVVNQSQSQHTTQNQLQPSSVLPAAASLGCDSVVETSDELTKRFVLRMVPSPQRGAAGRRPTWSGAALIIGDNPVAIQLESRLRNAKVPVTRWAGSEDPLALATQFDELIKTQNVRHLFLTTPCDTGALTTLDRSVWQSRRNVGLMSLYWLSQHWYQHVLASGWLDDASLVAVTSLGGDFGISGCVPSVESGALSGMLKAILIESWVQGIRTFPVKVIDSCVQDSPAQIANNIWQELAVPSFDVEVGYCQGERHVVRAIARPISANNVRPAGNVPSITSGGTWVCTGGARGITAYVAQQLAATYNLKLHLIGTQPLPTINDRWRELDDKGLRELKARVMSEARSAGLNPVTTWQDAEKAIEIDRNLRSFAQLGIEVHYHSCDVSDREQVCATLRRVRELSGPIRGVLHGAGIGKDARFDRKQPEKVRQCIGAKVDGAWALIEATWQDPLEAFVGFGSISGRFGANGHTDYSLANDMLCKQMDWLRGVRPEMRAVGIHWHAWGDVGMATKPETRLALEMVQMQFMPASEGTRHLLRELASDSRESEVLITDDRYYRLFYAPEALVDNAGRSLAHLPPATPLVHTEPTQRNLRDQEHTVNFEPAKDPFLTDHKLDDRPLLPIVIGTELMLEAARAHLGHLQSLRLHSVRAIQGLRFYGNAAQSARITTSTRDDGAVVCQLLSDFHARDGRLVQRDRLNMSGVVDSLERPIAPVTHIGVPIDASWHRPAYPAPGSKFYVGPPLQRLRGFTITSEGLVGRITAPTLIELAGGSRDVRGWQLPSAAVDACLFAAGILAWQTVAPGSALPTGFGEIEIGRMPTAGEACEVHVRLRESSHNQAGVVDPSGASVGSPAQAAFDFTLYGVDREVLVNVRDYRVAWLVDGQAAANPSTASARR